MSAVDFEEWAAPDLEFVLGGRTYTVRPPSVNDARKVLAAAVQAECKFGLVKAEVPSEVRAILDTIGQEDHPALGATFAQMDADGVPLATLDRVGVYAIFYWARGKQYADAIARLLWAPVTSAEGSPAEGEGARPKG